MVKLTFSASYIINQVKLRRLIFGISARDLSERIGLVPQFISKIESMDQGNQYSLEMLSKIADELQCKVRDFYPPDDLLLESDGPKIPKEIISLADTEIAKKVIDGMIDIGYFGKPKAFIEIQKYLHIHGRPEVPTVQLALDDAVDNGKLIATDDHYHQT